MALGQGTISFTFCIEMSSLVSMPGINNESLLLFLNNIIFFIINYFQYINDKLKRIINTQNETVVASFFYIFFWFIKFKLDCSIPYL